MTIKQRRRHRELEQAFAQLRSNPYLQPAEDYVFGQDLDEDKKYTETLEQFKRVVEEMHEIETAAKEGN